MSRQVLKFEVNQPQTVALEFPDGINVPGNYGPQVKFSLTENRVMFVPPDVAQAIKTLGVEPGQPFTITKRWESGKRTWWDVARVKMAAAVVENPAPSQTSAPTPKIESTPVSAAKPAILPGDVKRIPPQTVTEVPPRTGGMQLTRTPPVKPSYEEAFRECLRIVTAGLAQTGEQWSDGAKQAMVSTLMIQLGRENRLGEFRPQQIGKVA